MPLYISVCIKDFFIKCLFIFDKCQSCTIVRLITQMCAMILFIFFVLSQWCRKVQLIYYVTLKQVEYSSLVMFICIFMFIFFIAFLAILLCVFSVQHLYTKKALLIFCCLAASIMMCLYFDISLIISNLLLNHNNVFSNIVQCCLTFPTILCPLLVTKVCNDL